MSQVFWTILICLSIPLSDHFQTVSSLAWTCVYLDSKSDDVLAKRQLRGDTSAL